LEATEPSPCFLWQHRDDIAAGQFFRQLGRGKKDQNKAEGANLPWLWSYKGAKWLANPAGLLQLIARDKRYVTNYIYNPYTRN
jgi:hypothetical protein